jgi:uncharacterized protein (DUF342 family)
MDDEIIDKIKVIEEELNKTKEENKKLQDELNKTKKPYLEHEMLILP